MLKILNIKTKTKKFACTWTLDILTRWDTRKMNFHARINFPALVIIRFSKRNGSARVGGANSRKVRRARRRAIQRILRQNAFATIIDDLFHPGRGTSTGRICKMDARENGVAARET